MAEAPHLLVVDDDDRIRVLLSRYLTTAGYRITAAPDAAAARRLMEGVDFDLAILDVMLPGEDGLSLLDFICATKNTPVIMLTARDLAADRIEGLRRGADDYVPKPFEPEELSLRIGAILRRSRPEPAPSELSFAGLVYDRRREELRDGDKRVHLTDGERHLLSILAEQAGEPVSREDLIALTDLGHERSIDVQVNRLRQKIEPDPHEPVYLQTVRGVGYRLMPE